MKKLILGVALVVGLSTVTMAQMDEMSFSAKGGVNYSKILDGADYGIGFEGGAGLSLPLGEQLSLNVDALFRIQKDKSTLSTTLLGVAITLDVETELSSIVVPVVLDYAISDEFSVFGGAELGYVLSAKSAGVDVKDNMESFNYGLVAGAAYNMDAMSISLAYSLGLANLNKAAGSTTEIKPTTIILSGSYNF